MPHTLLTLCVMIMATSMHLSPVHWVVLLAAAELMASSLMALNSPTLVSLLSYINSSQSMNPTAVIPDVETFLTEVHLPDCPE